MNETIINGLFILLGTLIGSASSVIISIYTIKQKRLNETRLGNFITLCGDVLAYQELEKKLNQEISDLRSIGGQNQVTAEGVKREFRGKLKNDSLRINFCPSDVERLKNKLENLLSV